LADEHLVAGTDRRALFAISLLETFRPPRVGRRRRSATRGKEGNWFYRHTLGRLGPFWATVVAVEIMDLAFSLDNVFAAVAFTKNKELYPWPSNIILVCIGVFIGILAMRFAAQGFVKLMHRYPFLEKCAYIVIGILGVKLVLSVPRHFLSEGNPIHDFLASKYFDLGTSLITILIFIVPVIVYRIKGKQAPAA
jgi:predicted tellurium resistance membrane protein TerC